MSLLAFIPARGGSKGIPRKNLAPLKGKPLIEYTIRAALDSRLIDDILLSTDDDEIADVGRQLGLDVSYRRPADLAGDETAMMDALEHGLRWVEGRCGMLPEETLLLQPTSPLRIAKDIDDAVIQFRKSGALSMVSVHPMSEHPCECVVIKNDRWEYLVSPPDGAIRRQDYTNFFYYINGAIYLAQTKTLLNRKKFIFKEGTEFFRMPQERGVDVDTPIDLQIAEAIKSERFRSEV